MSRLQSHSRCEPWTVLFRLPADPLVATPHDYVCLATSYEDAEDYCTTAYPGAEVLWITEGSSVSMALADYWSSEEEIAALVAAA